MNTKKDSNEEKIVGNDPEIGPVEDEDPSQLDEEPDVDQHEFLAATEACDDGKLEDVTKSLDDKPLKKSTSVLDDSRLGPGTHKIEVAIQQSIRVLWGKIV